MFFRRAQQHPRPASANVQATANNANTNSAQYSGVNRASRFSPMRQHVPARAFGRNGQSGTVHPQGHAGPRLSTSPRGGQPDANALFESLGVSPYQANRTNQQSSIQGESRIISNLTRNLAALLTHGPNQRIFQRDGRTQLATAFNQVLDLYGLGHHYSDPNIEKTNDAIRDTAAKLKRDFPQADVFRDKVLTAMIRCAHQFRLARKEQVGALNLSSLMRSGAQIAQQQHACAPVISASTQLLNHLDVAHTPHVPRALSTDYLSDLRQQLAHLPRNQRRTGVNYAEGKRVLMQAFKEVAALNGLQDCLVNPSLRVNDAIYDIADLISRAYPNDADLRNKVVNELIACAHEFRLARGETRAPQAYQSQSAASPASYQTASATLQPQTTQSFASTANSADAEILAVLNEAGLRGGSQLLQQAQRDPNNYALAFDGVRQHLLQNFPRDFRLLNRLDMAILRQDIDTDAANLLWSLLANSVVQGDQPLMNLGRDYNGLGSQDKLLRYCTKQVDVLALAFQKGIQDPAKVQLRKALRETQDKIQQIVALKTSRGIGLNHGLASFDIAVKPTLDFRARKNLYPEKSLGDRWPYIAYGSKKFKGYEVQDQAAATSTKTRDTVQLSVSPEQSLNALPARRVNSFAGRLTGNAQSSTQFNAHRGFYFSASSPQQSNSNTYEVHVDFANFRLGGGWRQDNCAVQEELAVLECQGLRDAAQFCENASLLLTKGGNHTANPALIHGATRVAKTHGYGRPRNGKPGFTGTTPLPARDHRNVNWLALVAPKLPAKHAHLQHSTQTIKSLLEQAVAGFSIVKQQSEKLGKGRTHINSGQWGCGAFNNDLRTSLAVQIIAARIVGITEMTFASVNQSELRRAQQVCDRVMQSNSGLFGQSNISQRTIEELPQIIQRALQ